MLKLLFTLIVLAVLAHITLFNAVPEYTYITSFVILILVFFIVSFVALRVFLYFKTESEEDENTEAFRERRPKNFYNVKEYTNELRRRYAEKREARKERKRNRTN